MTRISTFLFLLFGFSVFAKPPVPIPLLPLPQKKAETKTFRSERKAIGFELGTIGIKNTTSSDVIGLQLLYGLRSAFIYPLGPRFFLKPSLGYFLKPEHEGEVSITQNLLEGGLGIHYVFWTKKTVLWHVGLTQKLDYLFSRISIKDSSINSPALFRYRAGAGTGFRLKISSKTDLTFDLEAGVVPFDNFRLQSAVSSGIIFFID